MTLSPSELRCMGLIPVPFGEMRCTRRNTCARFLERYAEGVTVDLIRMWMCPTKDDYWGAHLPAERKQTDEIASPAQAQGEQSEAAPSAVTTERETSCTQKVK